MAEWPAGTIEVAVVNQLDSEWNPNLYIDWAVRALVDGFDSDSLRGLSGMDLCGEPSIEDVRPVFETTLTELGVVLPEIAHLARLYVQEVARQVTTGTLSPRDATELIHSRVVSPLEHPEDLMPWCHLWEGNSIDCLSTLSDDELDEEITKLSAHYAKLIF